MSAIDLITISREYGAGGSLLAEALGKRLGWRVLDQEMPATIAGRLGMPADALVEFDEHAGTLFERIGQALIMGSPDMLVNSQVARQPDPAEVARVTRDTLLDAAKTAPLIIVGHGSQAVFQRRPGTLRLRLVAPVDHRVRAVIARRACTDQEARRITKRIDDDRAHYVRDHFHCDLRDPLNYHLVINTALVTLEQQVDLVTEFVARGPG